MEANESLLIPNTSVVAQRITSGELLLCDRGGRSRVWKVFSRLMSRDGVEISEYVYCKMCEKAYIYNKLSTSNLVKHRCYIENVIRSDNSVTITEHEKPTTEVVEMPANNLTKLLTKWILKDCIPCGLIQSEGLKEVFQELTRLGSDYGSDIDISRLLPSLSAVEKSISEIYEKCFETVKAEIASIKENGFGLTTNIWTDNFTKQSFIVLTIHYVKAGLLTFRLLGLKALGVEKATSKHIAETIKHVLADFDCRLSSPTIIVSEGGCDIIQAFPDVQNIQCITQLLNNALEKSLARVPEVAEIISACSKLVNFLKQMGLSTLLVGSLQTSRPTNWQSIYEMLNAVESSWIEIENKLQNINESAQLLTINIHHLKAVTKTCQPFKEAIETLEDDGYGTLHIVMVYLHELKKSCDTDDSEFKDFDFIESLKKKIRFYLERIVAENITNLHKLALFLYPPTNKLIQFSEAEKKCIESECICLMKCFENDLKVNVKQEPESPTAPASKRRKLFSDFVESETKHDSNELIMQEIQYYKNTRAINNADFDAFNWWELQKNNFPLLYKLSCAILATPASSAASKQIFAAASSLLCEKSKPGSKETEIEKIMFINSNAEHSELDSHFTV